MNEENNNSISLNLAAPPESGARLDLLYEIGRILASQETMNEAAPQILEAICRHLRFEIGELWCLGKDDAALHLDSVWHLPGAPLLEKFAAASRQFAFPVGEGLPGKVWAKNAPVWIENLGGEDQMPRRLFAEENGLQSGFAFPILLGDKFLGAFSFFSRARRQPDDALLQMFAAVGSHIGQFVKREKVEGSLRESQDRYRAFIKQSTEGIWRFELNEKFSVNLPIEEQVKLSFERGFLAECNDAMARMYNLERAEDLVGTRLADMLDASDASNVEYIRSFIESGYHLTDAESHEKDADGNDKYFLNSLVGTIENGYLVRVWGTQRDITEQKRADQSLIDNEERYRALVEATSTVVWRANEGGELSFVGSSWEQVSGQKIEEILGAGWLDALHPDDRRKTLQIWQRALASKDIYETEFRVLTTGGEYRWFAVRGVPILNPDGSLREWVGANTDIDERRAAEERVRESETRFRQMADSAPVMIWVTDSGGSCSYLSQSWYQFTGQTPETALGFGWLDATHPDDAQRSGEIFLAANAKHEPFRLEYRLRRADGTYAWAIDSAQPRFNQGGEFLGYIGSVFDITERKIAEERVRESEANFRQLAETVPQFVWVTETNGLLSYVNRQWVEFSGLTLADTNDPRKTATVFHPDDIERLNSEWEHSFTSGEDLEIEIRMREAGGDYCWFLTRSRAVKDASGKITKWFGTSTDITDRKKAESRLALIGEVSELARTLEDANELLFKVSQAVGEHLQVKRCLFNEIDLERDLETVHRDYCRGAESVAGVHRISDYSSITSAEMIRGKTVVNDDSKTDARTTKDYAKIYEPNGERAYVAVPLLRKNRWVASLWVSDDKPRDWSAQEVSLLETVAERTWTAVEKLRINSDLRESRRNLETALKAGKMGSWSLDLRSGELTASDTCKTNYGRQPSDEFTYQDLTDAVHPEDKSRWRKVVDEAIGKCAEFEIEYRVFFPDRSLHWVMVRGNCFADAAGKTTLLAGVSVDINERKQAEENLKHQKTLLEALTESVLDGILIVSPDGKMLHFNQQFLNIWNFPPEVVESKSDASALEWAANQTTNPKAFLERVGNVYEQPDSAVREELAMRDGRVYERFGAPIMSGDVRLAWVWTFRDITERKQNENALRESETNLRLATGAAQMYSWQLDMETQKISFSENFAQVIGLGAPIAGMEMDEVFQKLIHPDDAKIAEEYVERAAATVGSSTMEARLINPETGEIIWVETTSYTVRNEDEQPVRIVGVSQNTTRRRRAEAAVRESEERFRLLTENAEDYAIIFLDTDARITKWNIGAERILGWTEAEAVGQSGAIIFTPEDRADRVPEKELTTAAEAGHARDERWHLRRDGSRLFAFGEMIALYDDREKLRGYAKMFRDLTVRKQLDDALRESEERYRNLFNSIDEGYCIIEMIYDAHGKPVDYSFVQINPSFEKQTGMVDALGKTMLDFAPQLEKHWFEIYGKVAATGEPVRFENHAAQMNRWFDVYAFRFGAAENRQVAVLFSDITERKEIEAERERLLASEQKAREIAEDANFAKDEFIALVSHELRSPLNAMLGWTRILQEQNPDEKTRAYALDVIVRNARSQSRLIEDLLDIARVGKGKLRLELQPTELIPIIETAVETVKPAAEAGKINFTQRFDRAADFITGDTDRLRQVIENLLSNAVKFTAPGGSVEIFLERENGNAKITISDTGQGISPEFLPQIFERFKQAESSTTRRHGGLGIGLSLARDLVELHGGTISAESRGEGKGATFTVTLPLRMIKPIKENSEKRVEDMDAQGKLSGFWILAVDDEADARELVSFMLQINGAKVTTANSAVEALEILKNADGRLPDILLSDISMPNESGYALLEKIRSLPREHGGQIPAVALTAFNRPEDREAAFEAGFQKHLGKPVESEDLISAIIETAGRQ